MSKLALIIAMLALCGCSIDMTRADWTREAAWQGLNAYDAVQTANIKATPGIEEGNPLTRHLLGAQPEPDEVYKLFVTYGIAHGLISAALPPNWRKYWQYVSITASGVTIYNNDRMGL